MAGPTSAAPPPAQPGRRIFGPKRLLLETRYRTLAGAEAPARLFAEFAAWIHETTSRRLKLAAIIALCINLPLVLAFDLPGWRAGYADTRSGFMALVYWRAAFIACSAVYLVILLGPLRDSGAERRAFRWAGRTYVLVIALLGAVQSGYAHVMVDDVSIFGLLLMFIAALLHTPDRFRWFAYAASLATLVVLAWLRKPPEIFYSMMINAVPITAVTLIIEIVVYRQLEDVFIGNKVSAQEREKSERLLRNVLPEAIALRLRGEPRMIADGFPDATVLFADLVGFTELSSRTSPEDLVALLNDAFGRFDELAAKHGVEKIKTIGDAYMVACGLPSRHEDHLGATVEFAFDILGELERLNRERGLSLQLRVGIHCGSVVAGVIGHNKFSYAVWCDSVNMASRMESTGVPGRIQVTEAVALRLQGRYEMEERGTIEVKGKGGQKTYFLAGPGAGSASPAAATPPTRPDSDPASTTQPTA